MGEPKKHEDKRKKGTILVLMNENLKYKISNNKSNGKQKLRQI